MTERAIRVASKYYLNLDHSCNKYCNLIGQGEVTNSDKILYLHDSTSF